MEIIAPKPRKQQNKAFLEAYTKLNSEQKKAVDTIDGPVLVIAGPGSGKTQILSLRVANILLQTDTRASNILCLTFTDSAAANMRERLSQLIGHEAYRVCINTFHSFCTDIIGRYPEYFYEGSSFMPADDLTQLEILEKIFLNLPHDNLLRKEHPEEGFIYLNPTRKAIGELKKAGLTPKEFEAIINHNEKALKNINECVQETFGERLSLKQVDKLRACAHEIQKYKLPAFPISYMRPLPEVVALSLNRALAEALNADSTAPLTAWKQQWIKKNDDGVPVFKDTLYLERMRALANVYERYMTDMHKAGYFDFDDMILDVIQAIEKHKTLQSELQEQYQFVLVDEFQDTNDAQLRLLQCIVNSPVYEGKPNIMAVGDDDQAIYKFQGAEVSNMLNFKRLFGDSATIVLKDNYRSTQHILDVARHLIKQGTDRLENVVPELTKELRASKKETGGEIVSRSFPSSTHQFVWVAREVKRRIEAGTPAREIALIARAHKVLEDIVPFLHEALVPVSYERQQNVFEEPHIHQLILISRFIHSLASKKRTEADEFLPELLSFPFWELDRQTIWKLSIDAREKDSLWLDLMIKHENKKVKHIAEFLLDLSAKARYEPLERMLDYMIGSHVEFQNPDDDDMDGFKQAKSTHSFVSPFKEHYFNREKFKNNQVEYLTFLSSLRAFVEALREYQKGRKLFLSDLIAFVDLHTKHGILVTDQSPFASGADAVQLLSAHKAKGLEFDTVFVLSCQDEIWANRGRGSLLPFPINMPIAPAGDTDDDHLRLFYVALTRAKRALIMTSYEMDDKGRKSSRFGFLNTSSVSPGRSAINHVTKALAPQAASLEDIPDTHHVLISAWESYNRPPFIYNEEVLLKNLLKDYYLSITHLNNFLDITQGGPQVFLEQNLLQFPQAKTPGSAFGTAMHETVERIYTHVKVEGKKPTISKVISWFEENLAHERFNDFDFKLYRDRGETALRAYLEAKRNQLDPTCLIEVNFKNQGVRVGDAQLTGKIDKLVKKDGTYIIHDFKTGNALLDWEGHTPYEKIKVYRYQRQLLFYKILLEESRDFSGSAIKQGVIEFLEPYRSKIIDLLFDFDESEIKRLKRLIQVVYTKICTLDFPDISAYSRDIAGIKAFEDDLLKET